MRLGSALVYAVINSCVKMILIIEIALSNNEVDNVAESLEANGANLRIVNARALRSWSQCGSKNRCHSRILVYFRLVNNSTTRGGGV